MAVGNGNPYLGYASFVGVAEETTYSSHQTATSFIEFTSEGFKMEREELRLESLNTSRDFTRRMTGNETVSGSLEAPLDVASDAIIWIIKQAMGGTVASALIGTAGAYGHDVTVGDMESNKSTSGADDIKGLSMTIRRGETDKWIYRGLRVNTLTIKGEVGSPVSFSAELMGRYGTTTADSITASFSAINPLHFTGITLKTGDSITNLSAEYISSFEFTLANNLAEQRNLGSANIHALPPLRRDVKLKLTQQYDTLTSYNRFIQNTKTSIQILMDTGVTISGSGGSTYSMYINMPACYFNNVVPQVGGVDALMQEIDVSAIRDTTTSYSVQMRVNNATANY